MASRPGSGYHHSRSFTAAVGPGSYGASSDYAGGTHRRSETSPAATMVRSEQRLSYESTRQSRDGAKADFRDTVHRLAQARAGRLLAREHCCLQRGLAWHQSLSPLGNTLVSPPGFLRPSGLGAGGGCI